MGLWLPMRDALLHLSALPSIDAMPTGYSDVYDITDKLRHYDTNLQH